MSARDAAGCRCERCGRHGCVPGVARRGTGDGPCFRVNAVGPENPASACEAAGVRADPYDECSPPDATDWYGFTKRVGEARALAASSACAVVRIASPFRARHARTDLARSILSNLAAGRTVSRFDDIISTPTYVDDICAAIDHLASSRESGVFHVTNGEALSPHAFAPLLARTWGYPEALLASSSHADYERAGHHPYPKHLVLGSRRLERSGFVMPSLQDNEAAGPCWVRRPRRFAAASCRASGGPRDGVVGQVGEVGCQG
jgi:dTDP-4-dehydrorhamnose reductase